MVDKIILYYIIPRKLIIDKTIANISFYFYILLRECEFKGKKHLTFDWIKEKLQLKTNNALKKAMDELIQGNYITVDNYEGGRLPSKMLYHFKPVGKHFEQLDIETLNLLDKSITEECKEKEKIPNMKSHAYRLLALYWLYFNPNFNTEEGKVNDVQNEEYVGGYCCLPITSRTGKATISELIPIYINYIKTINDFFEKYGIVTIVHGEQYFDEEEQKTQKKNNRYIPMNIKKHKKPEKKKDRTRVKDTG